MKKIDEIDELRARYNSCTEATPHFTDRYGFIINEATNIKNENTAEISQKWHRLFAHYNIRASRRAQNLIFKGVPIFLKQKTWSILINKHTFNYENLCLCKSGYEYQIHVDVQRTFRTHSLFIEEYGKGQSRLFRVLNAFANYNRDIGYCQGMSSIAGLVLMYFPEKECLNLLIDLIWRNSLEGLFDKNLSLLPMITHIQACVFEKTIPSIFKHLVANDVDLSIFVFGWYLTLFSRFEIQLALRIWDLMLFFDYSILFLVSSAILNSCKEKILNLKTDKLMHFVSNLENHHFNIEKIIEQIKDLYRNYDLSKHRADLNIRNYIYEKY
ncbi:hypothetical protein COBT_000893 [Conglomerata obtusa]